MTARHLFYGLCFMICSVLAIPVFILAQGTPLKQGPLTVMVPPGWVTQTNVGPVKLYSPGSTPQQYLSVEFLPSERGPHLGGRFLSHADQHRRRRRVRIEIW
jgi:hypothetical protein